MGGKVGIFQRGRKDGRGGKEQHPQVSETEERKSIAVPVKHIFDRRKFDPGKFIQEIRDIQNQLEVIDCKRYRGAIVRARSEKLWLGEQPTKRALNEEKGFAQRKEIKEICYKKNVTRDKKTVERAFFEHYRDLLERLAPIDEGL